MRMLNEIYTRENGYERDKLMDFKDICLFVYAVHLHQDSQWYDENTTSGEDAR